MRENSDPASKDDPSPKTAPRSRIRENSDAASKDDPAPKTELSRVRLPEVRLPRLETLNLVGLPIQDQDLAVLHELPRLTQLHLDNTSVTDAGLPHVTKCRELLSLTLKRTKVTPAGVATLASLPKLINLGLSGTAADDDIADVLMQFPALSYVDLNQPKITDATLRRLGERQSPKWDHLSLVGTGITDAGLAHLRDQTLITLDCRDTRVTPEAFAEFARQHPILGMTMPTEESEAPDLRVARRILAAGGELVVNVAAPQVQTPLTTDVSWTGRTLRRLEDLPKAPFRITSIVGKPAAQRITNETLAEVGRLQFLTNLSLDHAAVTDAGVDELVQAPKLSFLAIAYQPLSSAAIRKFAAKTSLEHLFVYDTGLAKTSAAHLSGLTKLKTLDFGANPLTDDDIAFVEKLTDLEELGIGFTQIVGPGWASIAKLPKLKTLRAHNMPVTDEALQHAGQIESLESLYIASAQVTDSGLKHLRSLRHLRDLSLYHCRRITDAGLESLAELPALETLDLTSTPITDTGLKHLHRVPTLKSLKLTNCKLSDAAIDDLQDALPWCRIAR